MASSRLQIDATLKNKGAVFAFPEKYIIEHRKIQVSCAENNCIVPFLVYFKKTTSALLPDSEFGNRFWEIK